MTNPGASEFLPEKLTISDLGRAVQSCRGCNLYRNATQAVFGEGFSRARLLLVGEMPGNDEDVAGAPFVGPAGRVLDQALEEAGIERGQAYVTNVVKHFKWEQRGKRRLHKRPTVGEVAACRPWFDAELELVQPEIVVCLGSTAAMTLLGSDFRVSREHGRFVESKLAPRVMATGHPSAILRARDDASRERLMRELVEDLQKVAAVLQDEAPRSESTG